LLTGNAIDAKEKRLLTGNAIDVGDLDVLE
jgi:hypothetical protein